MAKKDYEKSLSEALGGKAVKAGAPKSLSDALRSPQGGKGGSNSAHKTTNMKKGKWSG